MAQDIRPDRILPLWPTMKASISMKLVNIGTSIRICARSAHP